jgi:hypothetical protein
LAVVGTQESLLKAPQFIHVVEKRQGPKIARLAGVVLILGFINAEQLLRTRVHEGHRLRAVSFITRTRRGNTPVLARNECDQSATNTFARQRTGRQSDYNKPERTFGNKPRGPYPRHC